MLTRRIIPCLDVKDNRVVKGVNFLNLRDAGDPVELGARYSDEGADELVFLDITATIRSRKTIVELVEKVAENVFIPFTVGGGIQNKLLCQFTANALGKKVVAGPIEATASGNVLMQAIAAGQINTLAEAREILRNSFELEQYESQETAAWRQRYEEGKK